jgi:hypothetical protein
LGASALKANFAMTVGFGAPFMISISIRQFSDCLIYLLQVLVFSAASWREQLLLALEYQIDAERVPEPL